MNSQENFEIFIPELSFPMFSATDFLKEKNVIYFYLTLFTIQLNCLTSEYKLPKPLFFGG